MSEHNRIFFIFKLSKGTPKLKDVRNLLMRISNAASTKLALRFRTMRMEVTIDFVGRNTHS